MLCIAIIVKNKKTSEKCSLPGFLIARDSGDYCAILTDGKLYASIWLPLLKDLKTRAASGHRDPIESVQTQLIHLECDHMMVALVDTWTIVAGL